MKNSASMPSHLHLLDALRGIASLAVIVFHYPGFVSLGETPASELARAGLPFKDQLGWLYENGWQAVEMFFTLSGFVFFWLYAEQVGQKAMTASRFFLLRFSRLYPLHLATLLAVVALQWLYARAHPELPFFVCSVNDVRHFAMQIFLASNWLPSQGFSFNFPVWSVSIEVLLYVIFFLFCRMFGTRPWIMATAAIAGWWLIYRFNVNLGSGMGSFFAGGLTYLAYRRLITSSARLGWTVSLLLVTCAVWITGTWGLAEAQSLLPALWIKRLRYFPIVVMFPSLVLLLAMLETYVRGARRIAWLGDISYATYLLHFPLQIAFVLIIDATGISRGVFYSPLLFVGFFVVLMWLSLATFHWFERPAQRQLRKLIRRYPIGGAPVVDVAFHSDPDATRRTASG